MQSRYKVISGGSAVALILRQNWQTPYIVTLFYTPMVETPSRNRTFLWLEYLLVSPSRTGHIPLARQLRSKSSSNSQGGILLGLGIGLGGNIVRTAELLRSCAPR